MTDGIQPVYNVDGNNNAGAWGNGGWEWIILLFFLMAWGNNGWGGFGNNAGGVNSPAAQGALTRQDLCEEFNFNNLSRGVEGLSHGICDSTFALNNAIQGGFANSTLAMTTGFNAIQGAIAASDATAAACCCQTQREIIENRYAAAQNTCDIINASNANTQRIIDTMTQNEMQGLRDSLQTANFQLSQQAQNATLRGYIDSLKTPTPVPAYITCSPYETHFSSYPYNTFNNSGCNCGC